MQEVVYLYHIADIVDETINCDRYIHRKLKTILDMRDLNLPKFKTLLPLVLVKFINNI